MTDASRLALGLLLTLPIVVGDASAGSLESLMAALSEVEERRALFVEERTLGVLDETLITEGTLSYQAPDRLIRQDLLPEAALYALEGDRLSIRVDGEERILALDQEPMIEAFIAPFCAVFAGDRATLEEAFDLGYAESESGWILTLTPKPATPSHGLLSSIEVTGEEDRVRRIETAEQDGDRSVMHLEAPPAHGRQ